MRGVVIRVVAPGRRGADEAANDIPRQAILSQVVERARFCRLVNAVALLPARSVQGVVRDEANGLRVRPDPVRQVTYSSSLMQR
jgi:hypothetical protein